MSQSATADVASGVRDLADIAASLPLGSSWPPPGTHVVFDASPPQTWPLPGSTNPVIVSDGPTLPTDGFWWTTLGNLYLGYEARLGAIGATVLERYLALVPSFTGEAASIPVTWRAGERVTMRWLRVTMRGTLAGTEQFQHKIDIGSPGSDPDIDEAAALALAEQLSGFWQTAWQPNTSSWPLDVRYRETGVVQLTATQATNAQGEGGNVSESYSTQWFPYLVANRSMEGSSTSPSLPYEVACAVTLQTDHRGPSGRGRLYMPPFATNAMTTGGRFNQGIANGAGTCVGQFLDLVDSGTPYVGVCVSERRLILNPITSINVGGVPDSQRRRRRSQDEARATVWQAA